MQFVVVMDPVNTVRWQGDTSFALMLAAQTRGHRVFHCLAGDISLENGHVFALVRPATMRDETDAPIVLGDPVHMDLGSVDAVLIRPDPPFDSQYLTLTLILEFLRGTTLVVNDPRGLREANEKLYACRFPELMPPTIVTSDRARLRAFAEEHNGAVLKPIDGHAGIGVLSLTPNDRNQQSILDQMTDRGRRQVMAQQFLDGVYQGDRRILLLNGEPLGAILRTPSGGDFRANIGVGGTVQLVELDHMDLHIIETLAPSLRSDGLFFVGIDVIAGRLSEVNVTSPTGIRQIARLSGTRPEERVIDWIEQAVSEL
jgi:glutathione synthase